MKKYYDREIWKIIEESKNIVEISNHGRFKTKYGIISNYLDNGYLLIRYKKKNNKNVDKRIHRLVAKYFISKNRNLNFLVKHIDGDKLNNHYTNLEWLSIQNSNRKIFSIPVAQYTLEGEFVKLFECINDVERECNIGSRQVCKVLNGKAYTAGGFLWVRKSTYVYFPERIKEKVVLLKNSSSKYRPKSKKKIMFNFDIYKENSDV